MQNGETNLRSLKDWAGQLACPACFGELRTDATTIVCAGCGRQYPIVDGVPVLIVERATQGNNRAS